MATSCPAMELAVTSQEICQNTSQDEGKAVQSDNGRPDDPQIVINGDASSHVPSNSGSNKEAIINSPVKLVPTSHAGVKLIVKDLRGTVKWYNAVMRYGFIVRTDTQRDVFVHRNSIVMAPGEVAWLNPGQPVTFDLWTLPCGRYDAKNVRAANRTLISFGNIGPSLNPVSFLSRPLGQRRPPQHLPAGNNQLFRPQYLARPQNGPVFHGQYMFCPGCGRMLDLPFVRPRPNASGFKPNNIMDV